MIFNRENPQNSETQNGLRRGLDFIALNYYDTSGQIVFIRFLEEFKTPKRHFEINWPLVLKEKCQPPFGSSACHFVIKSIVMSKEIHTSFYWQKLISAFILPNACFKIVSHFEIVIAKVGT